MEEITKILYWISTGFFIPVLILLLLFFIKSLILVGGFYKMYTQKLQFSKAHKQNFDAMEADNIMEKLEKITENNNSILGLKYKSLIQTPQSETHYNKFLNEVEIEAQKELARSQSLAKLGPILGLMGTLIPMGPALVGLANGDIASMATNMQVAFATTVIGLFVGAIGFIVTQVRKRWFASDLNNFEFVVELLKQQQK